MSLVYKYNLGSRARLSYIIGMLKKIKRKEEKRELKILDVGCGSGFLSNEMSKYGQVTGIDPEKESINLAKKTYKHDFIVASGLKMPFKKNSFDIVVTTEVIEHVPDDKKFLSEIRRVLNNKGYLILTTECKEGIFPLDESCHEGATEYYVNYTAGYTTKSLLAKMKSRGFKNLNVRYSLVFFSKMLMEIIKRGYKKVNPAHEKQSDIENVKESKVFKLYKIIFPVLLVSNYLDSGLNKLLKGCCIMTFSQLRK